MKYLYLLILSVFLVSCGAKVEEKNVEMDVDNITSEVISDINSELETLDNQDEIIPVKNIIKLDATYTNPAWEVDMVINYTLDDKWVIETIDVNATTYDLTEFNEEVKTQLVGKTLEEAKNTEVAWGSLTTEAFKKALK